MYFLEIIQSHELHLAAFSVGHGCRYDGILFIGIRQLCEESSPSPGKFYRVYFLRLKIWIPTLKCIAVDIVDCAIKVAVVWSFCLACIV